nr:hypothetical protein [uncultured Carboxylicivirga sp.]
MKKLIFAILLLISTYIYSQNENGTNSLELRVFNDGKYYIKELKINIDENEYVFNDIQRKKYSAFINLPYILKYGNHLTTKTIVKKIGDDVWLTIKESPIDHIGEQKIEKGLYTLKIKTKTIKKQLEIKKKLVEEFK